MDYNGNTCYEVYSKINDRQVEALMFHDKSADLFDFLALPGFKRMHEYQYFTESAEHRATKRYFMNHHGRILIEGRIDEPDVIPDDWVKYNRMDVTPQTRKNAIAKSFEAYCKWERGTKELYESQAKILLDAGKIADFKKVEELIKDVDIELKYLERLYLELKAVDFNDVYVCSIQECLHEEYRKKTKDIGIDFC